MTIHLILIDDHTVVRRGLRSFLESFADIAVVGEAASGEAALEQLEMWLPDVVVMDLHMPGGMDGIETTVIEAEPEPIGIDFAKTAILVVDMQNAFVSKGGYFDAIGIDISATAGIILPCKKIISVGRANGIKIVYLKMLYSHDLSGKGSERSPSFIKSKVPSLLRQRPELKDNLYIDGTWGAEIIEELKPQGGDTIINKHRHDGFIETNLADTLRTLGITYLLFVGTATNICVEP